MSSTIKLYEHNQKAYDALLDMLGECDRACVIKPTGTGKFVILAKMVQDNPDKRFLLLGTNDYMFNDQMANLAEIAPGFTPENLQFMTYSAAMMTARRGEEISGYDVVVADEFHHCGAEEWGKGVTHILDANESAKGMALLIGLHPNGSDPDEILTISIIGRDGSVLLDERFRPTVKTEWPHASAVNGIYPEGVADLPTIETAIPRLREIFAGADEVIGYNVGFDLGFLSAVGVRPREDARITDTMKEFTWFMGRRYKLVDAADHIGYEWTGRAHGSLADALATLAVQRWLEQWLVAE